MAIPDYQTLMLPLLRRLGEARSPISVRSLIDSVADEFGLTDDERAERIPSGQDNLLLNRMQWARTYMVKAGLIAAPKRGLIEITQRGRDLLAEGLERIDNTTLTQFPEYTDWLASARDSSNRKQKKEAEPIPNAEDLLFELGIVDQAEVAGTTPHERISDAIVELEAALRSDLLLRVRQMPPSDFESLIVKLLLSMGYGQGLGRGLISCDP